MMPHVSQGWWYLTGTSWMDRSHPSFWSHPRCPILAPVLWRFSLVLCCGLSQLAHTRAQGQKMEGNLLGPCTSLLLFLLLLQHFWKYVYSVVGGGGWSVQHLVMLHRPGRPSPSQSGLYSISWYCRAGGGRWQTKVLLLTNNSTNTQHFTLQYIESS